MSTARYDQHSIAHQNGDHRADENGPQGACRLCAAEPERPRV